jgi:hypothetical protein
MQYEIIVLPIDEVNRVGLSHGTNDRKYDEEREGLDKEHRKEKSREDFLFEALLDLAPFLCLILRCP